MQLREDTRGPQPPPHWSGVSVVMPLHNKAGEVRRAIESVLRQTVRPQEIVVVDDGSSDGSGDVVKALNAPEIRLIRQDNAGVSVARNRGIAHSTGEFIALLDADDEWEPGFLEAALELTRRFPDAGLYATGVRRCFGDGHHDLEICVSTPEGETVRVVDDYLERIGEGDLPCCSNVVIPRRVLDDVGTFPEGETVGEDRDLWVRIALKYSMACDSRILAIYHTPRSRPAGGRVPLNHLPPAVRRLKRLLAEGSLDALRRRQAEVYIDSILLQLADGRLWVKEVGPAFEVLDMSHLHTRRGQQAASFTVRTVKLIGPRLFMTVKLKLRQAKAFTRRLLREGEERRGRMVRVRRVPCRELCEGGLSI